ncbi:MAG: VIT1/CCC1 transporter family protein [Chloroflexota bacterium]|nr:VIT1/CCC1 transporter family protein [Chloroflexota bacterium]MDE3101143.1 VIT1/CCC1 transporter family protein [Chloroflexota bacterium]
MATPASDHPPDRAGADPPYLDRDWLAAHLHEERRSADLLGEIREGLFGAQDGIVSILTVVSTLSGATSDHHVVLLGGIATTIAEIFSMAAGEYMSSRSQRQVFEAQIARERKEVEERPGESQAEVAFMLEEEGLRRDQAERVAAVMATNKDVLLRTMVEKELGLSAEPDVHALRGAMILSAALGVAALVPLLPYMFLGVHSALLVSIAGSAVVLFLLGVAKSRFVEAGGIRSGLEIVLLAAVAGGAGYLVGTVLPSIVKAAPFP